jgi:putative flippase GtrA
MFPQKTKACLLIRVETFQHLIKSDLTIGRGIRFAFVGTVSGGVFATVVIVLEWFSLVTPWSAGIFGYAASVPINFLANRIFSFRSNGAIAGETMRFIILHSINMLAAGFIMSLIVDILQWHFAFAIVVNFIAFPIINFAVMNWWVFGSVAKSDKYAEQVKKSNSNVGNS